MNDAQSNIFNSIYTKMYAFSDKILQPYLKRDAYGAGKCFDSLKSSLMTKIGKHFIMRFISSIECEMTQRCMWFLWNSVYFGFVLNLLIQTCFLCFDWPWKRRIQPTIKQLRHFNTIHLVSLTDFIIPIKFDIRSAIIFSFFWYYIIVFVAFKLNCIFSKTERCKCAPFIKMRIEQQ